MAKAKADSNPVVDMGKWDSFFDEREKVAEQEKAEANAKYVQTWFPSYGTVSFVIISGQGKPMNTLQPKDIETDLLIPVTTYWKADGDVTPVQRYFVPAYIIAATNRDSEKNLSPEDFATQWQQSYHLVQIPKSLYDTIVRKMIDGIRPETETHTPKNIVWNPDIEAENLYLVTMSKFKNGDKTEYDFEVVKPVTQGRLDLINALELNHEHFMKKVESFQEWQDKQAGVTGVSNESDEGSI